MLEKVRRWVKDQLTEDEHISAHPKSAIKEIDKALLAMSAPERARNLEHVKAYADLYYKGRHKTELPVNVVTKLRQMERRVDRLNDVDRARSVVEKYGGPPSRSTVEESLSRTYEAKTKEFQRVHAVVRAVETPQKTAAKQASRKEHAHQME